MSLLPPIPKIWTGRFHRSDIKEKNAGTKRWRFYISRPTLELLRRTDEESQMAFKCVTQSISEFLDNNKYSQNYDGEFKIATKKYSGHHHYATLTYPFDLMDEDRGCYGIVIHAGKEYNAGDDWEAREIEKVETPLQHKNWPTMFEAIEGIDGLQYPPGINNADPRWKEFRMSKLLPADYLYGEGPLEWGVFRRLISHQFIEIRLVNTRNSRSEQIDALNTFHEAESGFCNFAGPPGTGKSTLLHMACANRLFENHKMLKNGEDSHKILYYVPSRALKSEANREVVAILKYVYQLSDKVIKDSMKNIHITTQDEMFLRVRPGNYWNLISQDSDDKFKNIFSNNKPDEDIRRIKRTIRSIIFGVFGNIDSFYKWIKAHGGTKKGSALKEHWENTPISLAEPLRTSKLHKITLNDFVAWDDGKMQKFLDDELPKITLFDEKQMNGFWDPTAMIEFSYSIHSEYPESIWNTFKGSVDCLVIDEVQDINISEIRILLNHFSNRQSENTYKEFKFISAGDENQTVMGLVFRPKNGHVRALFEDWINEIKFRPLNQNKLQLTHNLKNIQDDKLEQSYRVFDESLHYARHILTRQRVKEWERSRMAKTEFGRKGIFLTLPSDLKSSKLSKEDQTRMTHYTDEIFKHLEKQFNTDKSITSPVRVALTFDSSDYISKEKDTIHSNPIKEALKQEDIDGNITDRISGILERFGQSFIDDFDEEENSGADLEEELQREFSLRGVMTVEAIKGLTVPVTIVIPPKNFTQKIKESVSPEDRCKLLVQLTRAQYVNLLLRDDNYFDEVYKEIGHGRRNINTNIAPQLIPRTLTDILEYTMGMDLEFNRLLNQTLTDYESAVLWERTIKMSSTLEKETRLYVKWLAGFYKYLIENTAYKNWKAMYDHTKKEFKVTGEEQLSLGKMQDADENYGDGSRISEHMMNSLYIFLAVNHQLRKDGGGKDLTEIMRMWSESVNKSDSISPAQAYTNDWFTVILNPQIVNENQKNTNTHAANTTVAELKKCFNENIQDSKFPLARELPTIDIGSWALKRTKKMKQDNSNPKAWLETHDSPFKIPAEFLNESLNQNIQNLSEDFQETVSKIKLYISLIARDETSFVDEFITTIRKWRAYDYKRFSTFLPWFTALFDATNDDKETDFKTKIREKLEEKLGDHDDLKGVIGDFIKDSTTIDEMEQRIGAFRFEDWGDSINPDEILDTSIRLTSDKINQYDHLKELVKPIVKLLDNGVKKEDQMATIDKEIAVLKDEIVALNVKTNRETEKLKNTDAVTMGKASKEITTLEGKIREKETEVLREEKKKSDLAWNERTFRRTTEPFSNALDNWNKKQYGQKIILDQYALLNDENKVRLKKFIEFQKVLENKVKKESKKKSLPEIPKDYLLLEHYNELINPYTPPGFDGGSEQHTHNFFKNLFVGNKNSMMRLRTLYAVQLALSTNEFKHIRNKSLVFTQTYDPISGSSPVRKGIHQIANFWAPYDKNKQAIMIEALLADLHPNEIRFIENWLSFMESIEKAYFGINFEERDQEKINKILPELSLGNGWNLYSYFVGHTFNDITNIFSTFIHHCLGEYSNPEKGNELTIMSTDKYIQYIEGKTGDFIDFIQHKGKKGYNHITDTKFVDLLDDDFLKRPLPSSLYQPSPIYGFKGPFINTSLISALREVAKNDYDSANDHFSNSGLLNYAVTVKLVDIFRKKGVDAETILLCLVDALRKEYDEINGVMHRNRNDSKDALTYNYGINEGIRKNVILSNKNNFIEGNNQIKAKQVEFLSYLHRYDLSKAGNYLADKIEEMIKETQNENDYWANFSEKLNHAHGLHVRKVVSGNKFTMFEWKKNGYDYGEKDKNPLDFRTQEEFKRILNFIEYICTHKEPPKEEYYSNVELLTGVEGTLAIVFFEKEEIKQKVVKRDPPVTANNSKKEREANEIRETLGANLETKHLVAYVDIWMKDPENGKTAISREPALLGGQKNRILEILLHWMND
jgi:hypothetical protein